jgi:DNA-binding transcriptional MocR family regulator
MSHRYQRIAEEMKQHILTGRWSAGSKTPSIRACARRYEVSINTAKAALEYLEQEGLIRAEAKSGFYVCGQAVNLNEPVVNITNAISYLPLNDIEHILATILRYQHDTDWVNFALASPVSSKMYPLAKLKKATMNAVSQWHQKTDYALPPGNESLRNSIAQRGHLLGMQLNREDIIITHGATEAISLAIQACTEYGDTIAVESPTFHHLYPTFKRMGRKVIEISTSPTTGLNLHELEHHLQHKSIQAVITIPSGHNPIGFIMPEAEREQLVTLANRYRIAIIEDVIYAELQHQAPYINNIKAFDREGRVIVCGSFSKTLAPDYRIGWMEAGKFRDQVKQLKFSQSVAESNLLSTAVSTLLRDGSYDKHLDYLRKLYRRNCDYLRSLISQYFPEGTRISQPKAGFILWVELPKSISALTLYQQALQQHILIMPGIVCSPNPHYKNCIRMAACCEFDDKFIHALKTIGELAYEQQVR